MRVAEAVEASEQTAEADAEEAKDAKPILTADQEEMKRKEDVVSLFTVFLKKVYPDLLPDAKIAKIFTSAAVHTEQV